MISQTTAGPNCILVLILASIFLGSCAGREAALQTEFHHPPCLETIVAVPQQDLQRRSLAQVEELLFSLRWIPAGTELSVVTVENRPPLSNAREVGRALVQLYPADLRDRGVGGTTTFFILVDGDGAVVQQRLNQRAPHPQFDAAAARLLERMRFEPTILNNCRVATWTELPITFEIR